MRVALVNVTTTTKIGGVEQFVVQLAHSLAATGVEVSIFGGACESRAPVSATVDVHTSRYIDRAWLRRIPLVRRQYAATKLIERLSFDAGAAGAIRRGEYDIVHIHKPFDFPLASWLRRRANARIVYSSHGRDFFAGDRRFVRDVAVITACSAYNAAEVRERYGHESRIIYNGVDTDHFRPVTRDTVWRASLGIGDAPLALWVGRLERWKGTIDAVRALALMRADAHLVIVGDGPERTRLTDASVALGIPERVHLVGSQSHDTLRTMYASSDVVLGTSFANETFGMALAEASACARPVIATAFGGFPEVVQHERTGLLVPPRDPAALAAAIEWIVAHPDEARGFGTAGRAFVCDRFAWPVVTERVLAAYREALRAH